MLKFMGKKYLQFYAEYFCLSQPMKYVIINVARGVFLLISLLLDIFKIMDIYKSTDICHLLYRYLLSILNIM